MTIKHSAGCRKVISGALILAFLVTLADIPALARPGADTPVRVTNQDVRIEGSVALISYDLEATEAGTYTVSIELRRESDPAFVLIPFYITGDIGEVQSGGPRKVIRWEYLRTFPKGLRGEDYYFKIEVTRGGGFPWLWVALGSAAVAGGIVALVSGTSSSSPAQPGTQELPLPPPR